MRLEIENGLEFVNDPVVNELGKICFFHPFTGNLTNKLSFRSHFNRYSFYAINYPGHGNSVINNPKQLEFSYWLEITKQFFDKHNLKDVILFGHSIGGGLAVALTNYLSSDQYKAVLLEAPLNPAIVETPLNIVQNLIPDPDSDFAVIQKCLVYNIEKKLGANFKEYCEREKQKSIHQNQRLKVMLEPSTLKQNIVLINAAFLKLNCPALWIHGKQDGIIKYLPSKAYYESLNNKQIQFKAIEAAAHTSYFEQPQKFLSLVNDFFQLIS
ncbi:alpha/beta fold hydrolase [Mycoplasmoides genitalium]